MCRAPGTVSEIGERRDRQLKSPGVEANHGILTDNEIRLGLRAAQREVETLLECQLERPAERFAEVIGELVVAALANALHAGAG